MDLKKILGDLENSDELIKRIEAEVGREYVPRSEFNAKNSELKERDKQIGELTTQLTDTTKSTETFEKQIADLTAQVTSHETASLKAKIAHDVGLPLDMAGRLTGSDEKEIRADAETLARYVKQPTAAPLRSTETVGGGDNPYKKLLQNLKGE